MEVESEKLLGFHLGMVKTTLRSGEGAGLEDRFMVNNNMFRKYKLNISRQYELYILYISRQYELYIYYIFLGNMTYIYCIYI